ncbi:MAG TPA: Xaa-Pro dipeptidase [Steroidobacteraceae bacterium]
MDDATSDLAALHAAHLDVLRARFDRALAACGYSAVLIYSGGLARIFGDDQDYPFRVNAWFKAWVPLTQAPNCFLYYEPGRAPILLFHRPVDFWYMPAALPRSEWTRSIEIKPIADRAAARLALPRELGRVACLGEPFAEAAAWGLACNPAELCTRLEYERAYKTPYELACLRRANQHGARAHLAAARAFAGGASEREIELAFLRACGSREQELPYNPIVALNEHAAVLHYQQLDPLPPASLHSLLIDAGAEAEGYASDITRTYSFADPDFAALIESFDAVQQALCAGVHAGVDWRDVHLTAHRLVAELLHEADITACDPEEAVATGVSSVFLPHGLGHLLGLQVHDAGGLLRSPEGGEIPRPQGHPYLRLTRVLEEGFVVTMEPGIYFIESLLDEARADSRAGRINWSRVEQLRKFGGIRIEDDLAVTATGVENLTRDAFRSASSA